MLFRRLFRCVPAPSFWFRPKWPEQQLLSLYPSVAAAEDDAGDEEDALQL